MKKIIIKQMKFLNFKSFRDAEMSFYDNKTLITGDNGRGKSTIMAAFYWLLTGKDQFDSMDVAAIKTFDANNNHLPQLDHSVEGVFSVDGREIVLKRLLKEKWVTKRGETKPVMEGHTTDYFINGVACGTEREYEEEVEKIIPVHLFKLLTNPLYFNTIISWQERREILFQIAPPINDSEVIDQISTLFNKERVGYLTGLLNQGVVLDRQKKDLAAKKKEKKEQLSKIPSMITAAERTKPEVPEGGFKAVEGQINDLMGQLQEIDLQLSSTAKANEAVLQKQRERQKTVNDLKLALQQAEFETKRLRAAERETYKSDVAGVESEIQSQKKELAGLQSEIDANTRSIKNLEERKEHALRRAPELQDEMQRLVKEFETVSCSVFSHETDGICPLINQACRPLLDSKKEEAEKAFNANKSKRLDDIDARGLLLKQDKQKYEDNIAKFDAEIAAFVDKSLAAAQLQAEINDRINEAAERLESKRKALTDYDANVTVAPESEDEAMLKTQITEAETHNNNTAPLAVDNSELLGQKKELQSSIDNLKVIAARSEQIAKTDKQIDEYLTAQSRLAQEIATLDGHEDAISEFTRTKIASIESRIAQLFDNTRFRLFNTLINGEITECCDAIDPVGVPVANTNTAMKVNCGIDIINALGRFYGYSAPIFIDNKESISNISPVDAQVILLEKIEGQQTLITEQI